MRVVYIYSSLSKKGGTEQILTQKMNYLSGVYGYEVFVITNEQNNEECAFELSDKVTHVDLDVQLWKRYRHPLPLRLWVECKLKKQYRDKLLETLLRINPDVIVCCHTFLPGLICSLPIHAKKIVEAHNPRNTLTFTRGFFSYYLEKFQWMKELDVAEKNCDVVVSLTSGDASLWKKAAKVVTIPDLVIPYKTVDYPLSSKIVVSLGRLVPQKGYDLLINAWVGVKQKHPDWSLQIYGDGEQRQMLQDKIKQNLLTESVCLNPFTRNVEKVIADSSFLVCSSRYEGFGMTLVEAMMVGRPCVSFDCPYGPADIIQDKVNGILVPNGNVQALADAICQMIEKDSDRIELSKNAAESSRKYHPDVIMPKWKALFENL